MLLHMIVLSPSSCCCSTCAPSSSSYYYVVVATQDATMVEPHTHKRKKFDTPKAMESVVASIGTTVVLLHAMSSPSPSSSCYYIVVVTGNATMAKSNTNKQKKNAPPNNGGDCCCCKLNGSAIALSPSYYTCYTCRPSSSSYTTTRDAMMAKSHTNRRNKKNPARMWFRAGMGRWVPQGR
jgi:hypothetical protein